jgi:hypothetical protein
MLMQPRGSSILGLVMVVACLTGVGAVAAESCTDFEVKQGMCPTTSAESNGSVVNVRGEEHSDSGSRQDSGDEEHEAAAPAPGPNRNADPNGDCALVDWDEAAGVCTTAEVAPVVVTLEDLASFRPVQPSLVSEPGGFAIVGLPANFVSGATTHVVGGVLLGRAAEVRFTPVSSEWDYGDGVTRTADGSGASWAELGANSFTATPTSHVYGTSGTVGVEVTITYSAEYRFAGPAWNQVAGTVAATSVPASLRVVAAATMLVPGDCRTTEGPGC